VVRGQAVGVQRHPVSEPQLRVLPGELRRDPEGRAVLLPGQPGVARRRGHEPLLRRQWQAPLELLLQQLSARGAVRSQLWLLHLLLIDYIALLSDPQVACCSSYSLHSFGSRGRSTNGNLIPVLCCVA